MRNQLLRVPVPALRRLPALSCVPGHIHADLGNQHFRRSASDADDRLQAIEMGGERLHELGDAGIAGGNERGQLIELRQNLTE